MKNLKDLPADIYAALESGKLSEEGIKRFTKKIEKLLLARFDGERKAPMLRMSNLGQPCEAKLYRDINHPEDAEKLTGQTLFKFLYGDLLELAVLWLAEEAGHSVTGEQDEVVVNGVKGHRDAVIDGVTSDVKTASGRGFQKFKYHLLEQDDPFGYLGQLEGYLAAAQDDPLVQVKKQAAFIAVNKENGEIAVDIYSYPDVSKAKYEDLVDEKREMLEADRPPVRGFNPEPEGKGGNMKLGTNCSYCSHKWKCWPGLRGFAYSKGPVYLTKVIKVPDVPEFTNKA